MGNRELHLKDKVETLPFRTEKFKIKCQVLQCNTCKEEFNNTDYPDTSLEQVYECFRRKHKIVSANEIKSFRTKIGITQGELSLILGWGKITISRYEAGAIPDVGHSRYLKMIMNVNCLESVVEDAKATIPTKLYNKIQNYLADEKMRDIAHRQAKAMKEKSYLATKTYKPSTISKTFRASKGPQAAGTYNKSVFDNWRLK
jgi:putative zinc finger/helix-turn-helix YgiT family protein